MLILSCVALLEFVLCLLMVWYPRECELEEVKLELTFAQIMYFAYLTLMVVIVGVTGGFSTYIVIKSVVLKYILALLIPSLLPIYTSYALTKKKVVTGKKAVFYLYLPLLIQYTLYMAFCTLPNFFVM